MTLRLILLVATFNLAASAAQAATEPPGAVGAWTIAWVIGLLSGVALMVFTTFDWRNLPTLAVLWVRRQRRNAGWAALGLASIAVLAFY